ncbi:tRNA 2-thiouridine(34) synthase MnmA [bacterium]|nr:tRNA 2-thiouridine(34) synthase MnmA [bacterium]MBU1920186.1 tRNA 2-thiouridine(34) synthase MnmA [bacterium]
MHVAEKTISKKVSVAVAMSGGVDSAVAAALLQQEGHDVVGLTMHLWTDEKGQEMSLNRASGCCSINMANDAADVAERMGFRHYVLDLSQEFHSNVVKNFGAEYLAGRTPNPCIRCNTFVKWQTLLERARLLGCDYLATGHYARTERRGDRVALLRARYLEKDQSYALWGLSQESLSRTLFPVGNLEKPEVRRIARELNLAPADHPESQDICFVPDDDYRRFLNDNFGSELKLLEQGEIVGPDGGVLGYHRGIANYTIGQRRGLGIAADRPLYVTRIDPGNNRVHVDYDENCIFKEAHVREMNWVSVAYSEHAFRCIAKIRYRDEGHAATVFPTDSAQARIEFDEPVRAITPGQSAVFYENDAVLAGGLLYDPLLEG